MTTMKNNEIDLICEKAKRASVSLGLLDSDAKNKMLNAIASALTARADEVFVANAVDVAACDKPANFIDRLTLTQKRIEDIADGVRQVASLQDPIGEVMKEWTASAGFVIRQVRVPMGVVGIIYEARPNVTVDTAALCIKSSNAVVLRGGKDAINSNKKLVEICRDALTQNGFDAECVQLIEDTTHEGAEYFMTRKQFVDVLVPRGSARLIQSTVENATIPVIETGTGNCHVYICADADIEMAKKILINAKCQRNSVCNACESMLIDRAIVSRLPELLSALTEKGVRVHGCAETCAVFSGAVTATDDDYGTEYLSDDISCKVVSGLDEAVSHINKYGTRHSETVITADPVKAAKFQAAVDAAAVYHNASTRFTDGFVFGFGAELGISTQKLHARGPIGLKELTSYKYIVSGHGETR